MQVNMHEAKSQLSKLAEHAWAGEKVVIAKSGKPYLDLIPHREDQTSRAPGGYEDQIKIGDDFDETPADIIASFEADL